MTLFSLIAVLAAILALTGFLPARAVDFRNDQVWYSALILI
jgi:hypothetical protein